MDPSMITPEMMAFAQKQMENMSPEQMVRVPPRRPRARGKEGRKGSRARSRARREPQDPRRRPRETTGRARRAAPRPPSRPHPTPFPARDLTSSSISFSRAVDHRRRCSGWRRAWAAPARCPPARRISLRT
eukprot:28653-Pelagococcus_subviridis.AAC.1